MITIGENFPYGIIQGKHPEIVNLPEGNCFLVCEPTEPIQLHCRNGLRKDVYNISTREDGKWVVDELPIMQTIPVETNQRKPMEFVITNPSEEASFYNAYKADMHPDGPFPGTPYITVREVINHD